MDTQRFDQNRIRTAVSLAAAVCEIIRETDVPAGTLYAVMVDRLSLDGFNKLIATLKNAQLIEEGPGHMLRWIGPSREEEANYDPTPWCAYCGARTKKECNCGELAAND